MGKKIVVVGTGYVGLPLAIMLARSGHEVIGVDIEDNVVNAINEGILHLDEADIKQIFNEPQVRKNLHAQKTACAADVRCTVVGLAFFIFYSYYLSRSYYYYSTNLLHYCKHKIITSINKLQSFLLKSAKWAVKRTQIVTPDSSPPDNFQTYHIFFLMQVVCP